jgi:ElaB/YqjD/DUF883 family membrane-anchored ribosome-binding protein
MNKKMLLTVCLLCNYRGTIASERAAEIQKIVQATDEALKKASQDSKEAMEKQKKRNEEFIRENDARFKALMEELQDPKNKGDDFSKIFDKYYSAK